jgi:hypothetical protein
MTSVVQIGVQVYSASDGLCGGFTVCLTDDVEGFTMRLTDDVVR